MLAEVKYSIVIFYNLITKSLIIRNFYSADNLLFSVILYICNCFVKKKLCTLYNNKIEEKKRYL